MPYLSRTCACAGSVFVCISASAFPTGAPAGYTGSPASSFMSCAVCHSGPSGAGGVDLLGRPTRYTPGRVYSIDLRIFDPAQSAAGFEVSVETSQGDAVGELLLADYAATQYADGNTNYITHTLAGHEDSAANWDDLGGAAVFQLQWRAPEVDVGEIAFYVAANAADENGWFTGDTIYVAAFPAAFNACPPDLDGDGVVGGADLAGLLAQWGTADSNADFNGDGTVDGADLAGLLSTWGTCPT